MEREGIHSAGVRKIPPADVGSGYGSGNKAFRATAISILQQYGW